MHFRGSDEAGHSGYGKVHQFPSLEAQEASLEADKLLTEAGYGDLVDADDVGFEYMEHGDGITQSTPPTEKKDPPYQSQSYYGSEGWKKDLPDYGKTDFKSDKTGKTYGFTSYVAHDHPPTKVIDGSEGGWGVWVGKRADCKDEGADFDLVMNLSGSSIKQKHLISVPELAKWATGGSFEEMLMDWPDYGIVDLPLQFWLDLIGYIEKNKFKLLVFCVGGHGRTGTALACLLVAGLGWKGDKATKWVKKNYCSRAIESKSQENYILDISDAMEEHEKNKPEAK